MLELLEQFHFLRPQALWLLVPALLVSLLILRVRSGDGDWKNAVAPELLEHLLSGQTRRSSRYSLLALLLAWCIASVAAAGPSWKQLPQPILQKQDALILAMDLSYSMLATDLSPSRSDRVRRKLLDLLRQREEGLSALVAYAGDAHVVAPLTDDHRTIANLLPALDPTMMPLPGSNPADAVQQAIALFTSAGIRSGRILLVTDGVASEDIDALQTLLEPTAHRLAILGVGTDVGAPIPLGEGGFLKDAGGNIVVPALDESTLRSLATATDGAYRRMGVDDSDVQRLLADTETLADQESLSLDREADHWEDMAHWFTLPLLLICLLSFRRGWVYGLALCALLPSNDSLAQSWDALWLRDDQRAARALQAGDAERAVELFESAPWRGVAAWENSDYETAQEAFSERPDEAADHNADSWYNQGNALAAQGLIDEALAAYHKSLELEPDAADTQQNIEVLEQLKEQQQQQQQEQNQDSQDQQQDQNQPQDQNSQDSQQSPSDSQNQDPSDENSENNSQPQDQQSDSQQPENSEESEESGEQQEQPAPGEDDATAQNEPLRPEIDNSAMQEDLERDQAVEQWLRRVPDDPSGLLRQKFRYESRQRQQQGERHDTRPIW